MSVRNLPRGSTGRDQNNVYSFIVRSICRSNTYRILVTLSFWFNYINVYVIHFGSLFYGSTVSCIRDLFWKSILWVNDITFYGWTISRIRYSFRKSILWVNNIMYTLLISEVDFIGQRSLWLYHIYVTHRIKKVDFMGQRSLQDGILFVYRDRTIVILTSQFAKVTWVIWSLSNNLDRLDWAIIRTIEYRLSLS